MGSPEGSTVTFRRAGAALPRVSIQRFARTLQNEVAKGRPFDCLITSNTEVQRLNRDFRGKDDPTDVLSFPAAPGPVRHLGDIAISLQRAREQARAFGHRTEQEIQILMLHGVLHLLGMDHETDSGRMERAERRWRARFGLPNGLIERTKS